MPLAIASLCVAAQDPAFKCVSFLGPRRSGRLRSGKKGRRGTKAGAPKKETALFVNRKPFARRKAQRSRVAKIRSFISLFLRGNRHHLSTQNSGDNDSQQSHHDDHCHYLHHCHHCHESQCKAQKEQGVKVGDLQSSISGTCFSQLVRLLWRVFGRVRKTPAAGESRKRNAKQGPMAPSKKKRNQSPSSQSGTGGSGNLEASSNDTPGNGAPGDAEPTGSTSTPSGEVPQKLCKLCDCKASHFDDSPSTICH